MSQMSDETAAAEELKIGELQDEGSIFSCVRWKKTKKAKEIIRRKLPLTWSVMFKRTLIKGIVEKYTEGVFKKSPPDYFVLFIYLIEEKNEKILAFDNLHGIRYMNVHLDSANFELKPILAKEDNIVKLIAFGTDRIQMESGKFSMFLQFTSPNLAKFFVERYKHFTEDTIVVECQDASTDTDGLRPHRQNVNREVRRLMAIDVSDC